MKKAQHIVRRSGFAAVDSESGRQKSKAAVAASDSPRYSAVPGQPEILIRQWKGKTERGHFINRTFIPLGLTD